MVMEKQKVIIDELREKLNLPLDNLNKLSNDELKSAVDNAICQVSHWPLVKGSRTQLDQTIVFQMVNPVKIKENLVNQLKTQISDLERFIDFLQGESSSPGPYAKIAAAQGCKCSKNTSAFPIFNVSDQCLVSRVS